MKRTATLPRLALLSSCLVLSACVVDPAFGPPLPPPPHAFLPPPPIAVLPFGARATYYRGEHCWHCDGRYYRLNPHGRGYILFRP